MDDLLEILTQFTTEYISEVLEQDEEFRAARLHEREVPDQFESTLTSEQVEMFNDFISASSETNENIERIYYQQGMKHLFTLFKTLSK